MARGPRVARPAPPCRADSATPFSGNSAFTLLRATQDKALSVVVRRSAGPLDLVVVLLGRSGASGIDSTGLKGLIDVIGGNAAGIKIPVLFLFGYGGGSRRFDPGAHGGGFGLNNGGVQ